MTHLGEDVIGEALGKGSQLWSRMCLGIVTGVNEWESPFVGLIDEQGVTGTRASELPVLEYLEAALDSCTHRFKLSLHGISQ